MRNRATRRSANGPTQRGSRILRVLAVATAVCIVGFALTAEPGAAAQRTGRSTASRGSGYFVTFVGLWCNAYTDIFANRARNDIVESLRDLGPGTQYGTSGALINPVYEKQSPQNRCHPITGWEFALGTSYRSRADTGVWGSISRVTSPFGTSIVTKDSTPLLDEHADRVPGVRLHGATTIELTRDERQQASQPSQLWAQGGVPGDPVLANKFPGPEYGSARSAAPRTTSTATTSSSSTSRPASPMSSATESMSSRRRRAA